MALSISIQAHETALVVTAQPPTILSTTVGDITLDEYHLRLDGQHAWTILHAGAILSHDDEQRFLRGEETKLPYGIVLWPAAIALAHEIAERRNAKENDSPLKGARVLELGAGTGLPGIVASSFGAHVVQTERQAVALHVCKLNATRNDVRIEARDADWTAWTDDEQYDYILGADILYAEPMHPHLRRIFEKNLKPSGTLLLSDPLRKQSFELLEAMEADGWNVSMNKWTVGVVPPERQVGVFVLQKRAT